MTKRSAPRNGSPGRVAFGGGGGSASATAALTELELLDRELGMDDQDEQDDHDFVEYDDGSGVSAFRNQGRRGVGILSSLSPSPSPSPRRSRRRSGSWERNEENQKQSSTSRGNRPIPRNNEDDDEDGNGEFDDDNDDGNQLARLPSSSSSPRGSAFALLSPPSSRNGSPLSSGGRVACPDGHPMRRAVTSDGEGFVCMVCEGLWGADDVAHFSCEVCDYDECVACRVHFEQRPARRRRLQQQRQLQQEHRALGTVL